MKILMHRDVWQALLCLYVRKQHSYTFLGVGSPRCVHCGKERP